MTTLEKANRIINAALNVAGRSKSRIEDIQLYITGFVEPGYHSETGVIALGNWNNIYENHNNPETRDNTPTRVADLLEKLGVDLEWSDEWTSCSGCGGLLRTTPDSYSWKMFGKVEDGEVYCGECLKKDAVSFLESLEGKDSNCNTITTINPEDYGYVLIQDGFENGWHPGQNDNPKEIAAKLKECGISRYLFNLDSQGQFDMRFSVYVHESEKHLLKEKNVTL